MQLLVEPAQGKVQMTYPEEGRLDRILYEQESKVEAQAEEWEREP